MGGFNPLSIAGYALAGGPTGSGAIPIGQKVGEAFGGGGGGKGGGGPNAPDFAAAAERQAQQNRPDQTNAFGATSTWGVGPDGRPTQTTSLGGPLGGAATGLENQFAQANANPLDTGAQARQHAEDAIYGREASRLDPRFAQQEQQMNAGLANQGLSPGDAAYNQTQGNFGRAKNDAYQQAQFGAIQGGGQEAQRQQMMDLASREAPLQQLQGMQGLTQQSGFNQGAQYLPAAIAQYQGDLQKYGINQAGKNSTLGGLSGMAGPLAMLLKGGGAGAAGAGAGFVPTAIGAGADYAAAGAI